MSVYDDKTLLIYFCFVATLLGASFGSFLNCAAWRIARGESFAKGRSRCPECGHELGALDLIPVLSWLFLRGKCRYCGTKVPVRYLLTELAFAALTVVCLLRFDLTVIALRNWIFLGCLFCLSLVDLEKFEIPDGCLAVAAGAWLIALPFDPDWRQTLVRGLIAAALFGGGILLLSIVMDKALKRESLGGGDVKLLAVCGLYLGTVGTLFCLILACVLGLLLGALRKTKKGDPIPFGPAIALAAACVLLFGSGLIERYLSLIGV
jgi:leader peptidase (prepilin peptidase)/N-methyltransferase